MGDNKRLMGKDATMVFFAGGKEWRVEMKIVSLTMTLYVLFGKGKRVVVMDLMD